MINQNQKRVLVVSGPAIAHLTRPLAVADILRTQGIDVCVATNERPWVPIARARGYPIEYLPTIIDSEALRRGSLALSDDLVEAAMTADLALLDRYKPHVVLLDWRPSMRLAAAIKGVPVVAIVNAHV